ncbi:MAG: hypothetical protein ACRDZQ_08535 [Acidimicrobiales bacterium]
MKWPPPLLVLACVLELLDGAPVLEVGEPPPAVVVELAAGVDPPQAAKRIPADSRAPPAAMTR